VYLPPGYVGDAAAGRRFGVLYLLHGSPGGTALLMNAGAVGVKLDQLVASHAIRPFLIVMPNGGNGTFFHDTEWANTLTGRYEGFVLDVVRAVDARFPTFAERRFRAIAGLSEGAYGALNIALHNLSSFSVAGSWSGYFMQSPKGPFRHASLASLVANSPSLYVPRLSPALHRLRLHVYMYSGKHEKIVPHARQFAPELRAAGADVRFALYPGHHDWRLWREHMDDMLRYTDHWFWHGQGHAAPAYGHAPPVHRQRRVKKASVL
jgi:enterochelin esterase-like enzyme